MIRRLLIGVVFALAPAGARAAIAPGPAAAHGSAPAAADPAAPAAPATPPAPQPVPPPVVPPPSVPPPDVTPPAPPAAPEEPVGGPGTPPQPIPPPAPPPEAKPTPPPTPPPPPAPPAEAPLTSDELPNAGYVPGYRTFVGLGMGPSAARSGSLAGGMTPGYGAPMPPGQWTFRFNGYMSASFQSSLHRRDPMPGQSATVFRIPPQTVDEYASFLGTSTMPGQWVALNFGYGNNLVSAHVSLNTWNPSQPATYYQVGAQYFINNAYIQYDIPQLGELKLRAQAGYFFDVAYGGLSQYGLGMYTNPFIAIPRGVGESVQAEYSISPTVSVIAEHGIMGNRNGKVPDGITPNSLNASANPVYPAAWIHHAHLGLISRGEATVRVMLHYLTNWAQDERSQQCDYSNSPPGSTTPPPCSDNPTTRGVNEAFMPDGRINVFGADGTIQHGTWGFLGLAGSYVSGHDSWPLRGLITYGGEGQQLTERWWGTASQGTGKLWAAGLNWTGSVRRILFRGAPASSDDPDITLNAGLAMAYTLTSVSPLNGTTDPNTTLDTDTFNHRFRWKAGVDALYNILPFMGLELRVDRVAPSSKDSQETFYVVSPRVVFKTAWISHETIQLIYGKWFYGPHTHPDASSLVSGDIALDDQLIALNANMWW